MQVNLFAYEEAIGVSVYADTIYNGHGAFFTEDGELLCFGCIFSLESVIKNNDSHILKTRVKILLIGNPSTDFDLGRLYEQSYQNNTVIKHVCRSPKERELISALLSGSVPEQKESFSCFKEAEDFIN